MRHKIKISKERYRDELQNQLIDLPGCDRRAGQALLVVLADMRGLGGCTNVADIVVFVRPQTRTNE